MQPKLVVLDQPEDIKKLQEYLADKEYIAYDCETTGVHKGAEVIGYSVCAEEAIAYYVILAAWNPTTANLDYLPTKSASIELIESLKGKSLIMHNGVFDCWMAENFFKISLIDSLHTDTMILAHLLDENRKVGLKELGKQYFGQDADDEAVKMKASVIANLGELTKKNYELYKADPYLMGTYGAKDAWLTFSLFMKLVPELETEGLYEFFYQDESMPLLKGPTYELNTTGLKVDLLRMAMLKKTLEAECLEAKAFIMKEIEPYIKEKYPGTTKKTAFNIGSSQQLAWLLFGVLKLEFGTLTKGGKAIAKQLGVKHYSAPEKRRFIETCLEHVGVAYELEAVVNGKKKRAKKYAEPWKYIAVDKKTLTKLAPRYKWIDRLLEHQRKNKILTTYVEGIGSRVQYGIIQPSFLQHGTTSGRYSSRGPNFQNLPRDDKRIKECIISRPGKVFVGADYSQLEPRVFAFTSGDTALMKAFTSAEDFYSVIGIEVYDKYDCTPFKDGSQEAFGIKYKKLRDLSKVIALASTYGATAHQLAPTTGKSIADTQADMDKYFERFPDVAKMMTDSHEMAKTNGYVQTLFGRKRRLPEALKINKIYGNVAHAELPYEARNILNLAVNHRIQGTGASIVNRAAIKFHANCKEAGIECRMVCQVHDSIIIECEAQDAENINVLLQDAMENTVKLPGINLEAVPKIGANLAET